MTTRPLAEIEQELADTQERVKLLQARATELRGERDRAMARDAEPHPWLGRKVKRWVKVYRDSPTQTQRGIVQQAGATVPYGPRGHRPAAGETYVASESGQTRYRLEPPYSGQGPWELDE